MREKLRQLGRAVGRIVWGLALTPTFLLVLYVPKWDVFVHSDWWRSAALAGAVVCVAFAAWAKHRRQTIVALVALSFLVDALGLVDVPSSRIIAWGALMVLVIVVLEAIRQNVGLVRDMRREDPQLGVKVGQASLAWFPMLVFAWAGWLAHGLIVWEAEQVIYDLALIDEYCQARPEPVPCQTLRKRDWQPVPLTVEETLAHDWETRIRARQQELLRRIESSDPADGIPDKAFQNKETLAGHLEALDGRLMPHDVLGLSRNDGVDDEDQLINADPLAQRLRREIQELEKKAAAPGRIFGPTFAMRAVLQPTIEAKMSQLQRRLKELSANRIVVAGTQERGDLQRRLDVAATPPLRLEQEQLLVSGDAQVPAARATLAAVVIARLANMQETALVVARQIVLDIDDLIARDPNAAEQPIKQIKEMGIQPLCRNDLARPGVSEDDDGDRAVSVERQPYPCDAQRLQLDGAVRPLDDVWDSVDRSIQGWRQKQEERLEETARRALVQAVKVPERARAKALGLEEMVPAGIQLGRKRCKLLEGHTWGNCATNWGKAKAEKAYASARTQAGRAYKRAADEMRLTTESNAAQLVLRERKQGLDQLEQAESSLHAAVKSVRASFDVVGTVLLFFLAVAMVKSALYTIAMKVFAAGGPSVVRVDKSSTLVGNPPRVAPINGQTGSALDLADVTAENPLFTREYLAHQVTRNARMPPWPLAGVVTRLLHGRYFFFNAGGPQPGQTVAWFSSTGRFIADWVLLPGEAVVFHYRNFVGASKSVVLRSVVSLRLDTMLFGRFTFAIAVATEPGHLLLEAKSLAVEGVATDSIHTAMPERLIAWHAHTGFQVASSQTLGSVYLDPYALTRVENEPSRGRMLVDTTPVKSFFYGTFRYAFRVLSPL